MRLSHEQRGILERYIEKVRDDEQDTFNSEIMLGMWLTGQGVERFFGRVVDGLEFVSW
jgi:hypothetical protein